MNNTPEVTIILPAYNGARWIEKAVASALDQSFGDFEFIIINDGSSDNTESLIMHLAERDARIKYFKNERNIGVQKTRNIAMEKSLGSFIAEIDQDDEWIDKDKLLKQVEFLNKNTEYVLVGTGTVVVNEKGMNISKYLMPETDSEIRRKILRRNCFIHSSVVYKAEAVRKVGGYTAEKMSEDHDLWLRLGRIGKFANLPDYSVQYRFSSLGYNSQDKFIRLRQNLLFVKEHKDFYPGYLLAVTLGITKICFYPFFNMMPIRLKGVFLKLHKKM